MGLTLISWAWGLIGLSLSLSLALVVFTLLWYWYLCLLGCLCLSHFHRLVTLLAPTAATSSITERRWPTCHGGSQIRWLSLTSHNHQELLFKHWWLFMRIIRLGLTVLAGLKVSLWIAFSVKEPRESPVGACKDEKSKSNETQHGCQPTKQVWHRRMPWWVLLCAHAPYWRSCCFIHVEWLSCCGHCFLWLWIC